MSYSYSGKNLINLYCTAQDLAKLKLWELIHCQKLLKEYVGNVFPELILTIFITDVRQEAPALKILRIVNFWSWISCRVLRFLLKLPQSTLVAVDRILTKRFSTQVILYESWPRYKQCKICMSLSSGMAPPTYLKIEDISDSNGLCLRTYWDSCENASEYNIILKNVRRNGVISRTTQSTNHVFVDLKYGSEYYCKVQAIAASPLRSSSFVTSKSIWTREYLSVLYI